MEFIDLNGQFNTMVDEQQKIIEKLKEEIEGLKDEVEGWKASRDDDIREARGEVRDEIEELKEQVAELEELGTEYDPRVDELVDKEWLEKLKKENEKLKETLEAKERYELDEMGEVMHENQDLKAENEKLMEYKMQLEEQLEKCVCPCE
jgi:chromosome segregation ATPase